MHPLRITVPFFLLITLLPVAAVTEGDWERIDSLHDRDRHEEVLRELDRLAATVETPLERSQLLWRRARGRFSRIDLALYAGELSESQAQERLGEIREIAEAAVAAGEQGAATEAPAEAYFWRGAVLAKIGELRGVLNALFMADDLRENLRLASNAEPEYANTYYVAGQLYHRVPGFPISFGDGAVAVSFSRRAVDLHDAAFGAGEVAVRYWDYYVKLAEHLQARGWSQRRRRRQIPDIREKEAAAADPFEAAMYYEGIAELPESSDEAEAAELLEFVVSSLSGRETLSVRERRTLEDARALQ